MAFCCNVSTPSTTQNEKDIFRGCLKNHPSTLWGETFASLAPKDLELESHMKEVEAMKVKVKNMLLNSTKELTNNIQFINLLCRLGVSYHFENEIDEQLNHIFTILPKLLEDNDYDLCTLANLFRVLRQHGYKMTCDVFKKFKNEDGEFKEDIVNDENGILCLYEACFMAIDGEDILDEALVFTRKHLEILVENSNPHLQKHIRDSLMYPSRRTTERLQALNYISFYQKDESANETLLKFAKLDYNGLQLLYRKELAFLSRWWKNINAPETIPHARDRLVESYMWALGCIFEPQYSISRMLMCKFVVAIVMLDDTYDSYGTIDELRLLTTAFQRFTVDVADELPECMKFLYKVIFDLFKENDGIEGCSCKNTYAKEMMKELAIAYNVEAIWQRERKAPSMGEYTKIGKVTSAYDLVTSAFIFGVKNMGMKEILWIRNSPEIVVSAKLYARFMNDISGARKDETKRGDFPKVVDCYIVEHRVSKGEAIEAILKIVEDQWKAMNEDFLKTTNVPRMLLKHTYNYARITYVFYKGTDMYTYRHNMKPLITSLIIDPLPL